MPDYIKVFDHGTGPVDLQHLGPDTVELRPTEIHYKADGDKEDNPSFCIVMVHPVSPVAVYGQFSLNTIQKALAKLGYTLYQP